MKVKDLIHELQKYDEDAEVAVYNRSTGSALWIPNYDPDIMSHQMMNLQKSTSSRQVLYSLPASN